MFDNVFIIFVQTFAFKVRSVQTRLIQTPSNPMRDVTASSQRIGSARISGQRVTIETVAPARETPAVVDVEQERFDERP